MTQTFDAHQMLIDGVMNATDVIPLPPVVVDAYHIYKRPGESHWRARYHRMLFSDPLPFDEAVQRVASGLSCYVVADGLQAAVEHLAQLGVVVNKETPQTGKRGM